MSETQPLLARRNGRDEEDGGARRGSTITGIYSRWNAFRSSQKFKLIVVATALFTDNFLYGVIVPTLPYDLPARSHVPPHEVEFWTSCLLAAYGLSSGLAAPVMGFVSERTSNRRGPLLFGLLLLTAATLIYGFVTDVHALVAARVIQGLSASIVYTSGLAFLVDSVDSEDIGGYVGAALSAENVGLMISPLIGGPLYAHTGRNGVVTLMVGLIAIDIVLRLIVSDNSNAGGTSETTREDEEEGGRTHQIDSENSSDTYVHNARSRHDSAHNSETESILNSSDGKHQKGSATTLSLLKNPRILSAAYGLFLAQVLLTTFDGVLPRFTQKTYGWNPTAAGLIFLALSIPSLAAAFAGTLSDKYGPKWITIGGFVLAIPACAALTFAEKNDRAHEVILCILLALIGLAVAFVTTPLAADMALVVEAEFKARSGSGSSDGSNGGSRKQETGDNGYGQVFSILLFAQCAGILAGPSWAGFAYKRMSWTFLSISLAVITASALLPSLFFTGGRLRLGKSKSQS